MINIVLFGPPGAGKGTQSENLIKRYQLSHISTGDLFRKHLKEGTPLGKLAQRYMDEGNLVPDQVVIDMVDDKIQQDDKVNGYIFDGFPRTVAQAKALDQLMNSKKTPISGMIALEVPKEELIKRLLNRGLTSGRTDDQDESKINNRIQVYLNETLPVANYYREQGKFNAVEGVGSLETIFASLCQVIDKF